MQIPGLSLIGFLRRATTWRAMMFLIFLMLFPLPQLAMVSIMSPGIGIVGR
jgi:hypothetical protein